jgi:hypothetical protein
MNTKERIVEILKENFDGMYFGEQSIERDKKILACATDQLLGLFLSEEEIEKEFTNLIINEFLHQQREKAAIPLKYFVAHLLDRKKELSTALSTTLKPKGKLYGNYKMNDDGSIKNKFKPSWTSDKKCNCKESSYRFEVNKALMVCNKCNRVVMWDELPAQGEDELDRVLPKIKEHSKDCWSLENTGNDTKYRCDCGTAEYNQGRLDCKQTLLGQGGEK